MSERLELEASILAAGVRLEEGDPRGAFDALRPLLARPRALGLEPAALERVLGVFARIAAELGSEDLAEQVERAQTELDDPETLFALGYALVEHHVGGLAAAALFCADAVAPATPAIIGELCAALEATGDNREALCVLEERREVVEASFHFRYLRVFNALLAGDVGCAERHFDALGALDEDGQAPMRERLAGMLRRAHRVRDLSGLGPRDLRGWHFAITGGLVTHLSPHGLDAGMNGRYAFVQDSFALCREGLERLALCVEALELAPSRVLAMPDRSSQILARAAAERLGLGLASWSPNAGAGLVVAYDLAAIEASRLHALVEHRPGQHLFAHALCFTSPPPLVPDLCTLFHQFVREPWGERLQVTNVDAGRVGPDERSEEALAELILDAPLQADALADSATMAAFAHAVAPDSAARQATGVRERWWGEGPVKSNRF
jgi:hypothetical protein